MNGTSNVETEETLAKGLRVDIVINNEVVLECKQDLKNSKTLKALYGEIQRIKRLKRYTVYAVIYGDARRNLYEELCEEVGEYNVILLGKLRDSR